MRIVVVGAAGRMTSVIVETLRALRPDAEYLLADLSSPDLERLYGAASSSRLELRSFDVFDPQALRSAVAGARLVINGTGPFYRTLAPVCAAAIECGADYLDIADDNEACLAAIDLDARAKAAGVALRIGCGASPGFTNVLAADVLSHLDRADDVEVAWVAGDEGPQRMGRAVAEHAIHIGGGECLTWRDGRAFVARSFVESRVLPMGGELGDYRLYETAHPETLMLPRSFPRLRNVWCWGGLHPQSLNGFLMGLGRAHVSGRLDMDRACRFLQSTMDGGRGEWSAWRYALGGILGQVVRGENDVADVVRFFASGVRKGSRRCLTGTLARASGTKGGRSIEVVRATPIRDGNPFWSKMATCTGVAAAAFASLALERDRTAGTLFPENWVGLDELVARIEACGFSRPDVVEPTVTVRPLDRGARR